MKITTGLLACLGVLAVGQAAQAAPKVSGKYAYHSVSMCQALVSQNKDSFGKVTSVNPNNGGLISAEIGYITFPNTPASSGKATVTGTGFEGDALRISSNNTPPAANVHTQNTSMPNVSFSLTETTFTLAGQSYMMRYGNVVSGVARTVDFVRKEDPRCINIFTVTKQ